MNLKRGGDDQKAQYISLGHFDEVYTKSAKNVLCVIEVIITLDLGFQL